MAWIRTIDESDAEGPLAEIYRRLQRADGGMDHILKIHGLNPQSLAGHYEYYRTIMR
ncbi:MAG: peroxidase-related enzyme, partial [Gemmatimonadota bacterium]